MLVTGELRRVCGWLPGRQGVLVWASLLSLCVNQMDPWFFMQKWVLSDPVTYRSLGNFRGKKFPCDNFSRVTFSFSGPSTKIYHRENLSCTKTRWTSTEELCVFVAITFIVKSGR